MSPGTAEFFVPTVIVEAFFIPARLSGHPYTGQVPCFLMQPLKLGARFLEQNLSHTKKATLLLHSDNHYNGFDVVPFEYL
jgi:hypothetical protein